MVLSGNSAFIYGSQWMTALVSLSNDPIDYCGTIINLGESELDQMPPIPLPGEIKWAYHYGSCAWHQVTSSFYDEILLKGKVNKIKRSQPYKLNCSFLQDSLSFETVSNLGQVGNLELFPEKLGLVKKRLMEFKKPDGTQYTELEEEDYLVAVNPIGPSWRIIPKNSLIGEPFKSIDGSIRWRPNLAINLLSDNELKLTGKVAFIGPSGWKYGFNQLINPKPEDFASHLTNYNGQDPLYQEPNLAGFYRYHIKHGMWYQMDYASCLAIEKINHSTKIEYYQQGAIKYNTNMNQAKTKVNMIEVTGELAKELNEEKVVLMPDQIVETENGLSLLVDLVNRSYIPKDTSLVQTNNKIAIKKWNWIYGTSELYEYNRIYHFAGIEGPGNADPGYKYCYHLLFHIWFQLTEDSYQRVLIEGNIPSSTPEYGSSGPLSLIDPGVNINPGGPDLASFINPDTSKNYRPEDRKEFVVISINEQWKPIKRDTFIWAPVTLIDENNYQNSYLEPTTIAQFWIDNNITDFKNPLQAIVNYNRCAFFDTISQAWSTGTVKLDSTNGLPQNFYINPSPYLEYNEHRVNLRPKQGYVWVYHLDHNLWYEVDPPSAGRILTNSTRQPDFILDFIPDDLPLFIGQYQLTEDYSLRKSVTEIVLLEDNKLIVLPASSICVTVDGGGLRLSTLGTMVADYTNQTEVYLTSRAVIQYRNNFRIGLNAPALTTAQYRIRSIGLAASPDCCWVYAGHNIWQEVTRESCIKILLTTPGKSADIEEVVPLTGDSSMILSDQSGKSEPVLDYYKKRYSQEEKAQLTDTKLGTLKPDSIIRVNTPGQQFVLLQDLIRLNDVVSPTPKGSKYDAWFKENYWIHGIASPDKFDPSLFNPKVMTEISRPGYFWHQYPSQGIYYEFTLDDSVRISLLGRNDLAQLSPPPSLPIIGPDGLTILDSSSNPIKAYDNKNKTNIELERGTIVAVQVAERYQLNLADNLGTSITIYNSNNTFFVLTTIGAVIMTITVIVLTLIPH